MRSSHRVHFLLVTLALLATGAPSTVRAECDAAYVRFYDQSLEGIAAARAITVTDTLHRVSPSDPTYVDIGSGFMRVALATREFETAFHSTNSMGRSCVARDEYRVVGAPAGSDVTFRVHMVGTWEAEFYEHCGGSGCNPVAGMTVEGSEIEHLEYIGLGGYITQLRPVDQSMTLVRRAEEPFLLSYYMQGTTSHSPVYVYFKARVEFDDLPPGVRVVSCLEDHLATANSRSTWGSLKARYR